MTVSPLRALVRPVLLGLVVGLVFSAGIVVGSHHMAAQMRAAVTRDAHPAISAELQPITDELAPGLTVVVRDLPEGVAGMWTNVAPDHIAVDAGVARDSLGSAERTIRHELAHVMQNAVHPGALQEAYEAGGSAHTSMEIEADCVAEILGGSNRAYVGEGGCTAEQLETAERIVERYREMRSE